MKNGGKKKFGVFHVDKFTIVNILIKRINHVKVKQKKIPTCNADVNHAICSLSLCHKCQNKLTKILCFIDFASNAFDEKNSAINSH